MTVQRKAIGQGFGQRIIFGSEKGAMSPRDFIDTLGAHLTERLWTLAGQLARIESDAISLHDSPSTYGREALALIDSIRSELAAGNAEQAVLRGIQLGQLWREHDLKVEHEADARTGRPIRRGLSEGRERANRDRKRIAESEHRLWQQAAEKAWARSPHLSKNAVAKHVQGSTGTKLSVSTIAQKIKKPPKAD